MSYKTFFLLMLQKAFRPRPTGTRHSSELWAESARSLWASRIQRIPLREAGAATSSPPNPAAGTKAAPTLISAGTLAGIVSKEQTQEQRGRR